MLERFGTLRYQIALLLLLVIAPLAAFAIYLEVEDRRKDAQQAEAESRQHPVELPSCVTPTACLLPVWFAIAADLSRRIRQR
jgi:hypothetical protein